MNGISIRIATLADAAQIAAIHCASWRDAYANVLDEAFLAGPIEEDRRSAWFGRVENPDKQRTILVADVAQTRPAAFSCVYVDLGSGPIKGIHNDGVIWFSGGVRRALP